MINPCREAVEERVVYRILDKKTNSYVGVYSRACHDEFDFSSEYKARNADCHGTYKDKDRYDVVKLTRYYIDEQQ